MLDGQKDRGIRISSYPHALPVKKRAFSLIEILIVALILSVVLASLFLTLNMGYFSSSAGSVKIELQAQVRLAMDWLVKDLRQAISWNITSTDNNPTITHLKFNLWNWNNITNAWDLDSAAYIEYNYDSNLRKLTRISDDGAGNIMTLEFNDIIEAPFYTSYVGPADPGNVLDCDQLRNQRRLIIVLSGRKHVRGSLFVPFNLKSEVRIRNG